MQNKKIEKIRKMNFWIKKNVKRILMELSFWFLKFYSILEKKKIRNFDKSKNLKIGVLFLKPLGFGDLIMLSPAIEKIPKIFPNSEVFLITWIPEIINFQKINYLSSREAKNQKFDLIISPTLNLRHLSFIFKANYWIGYFAESKIQSNFSKDSKSYHPKSEHYLLRALKLLEILDKNIADKLLEEIKRKELNYPPLVLKEPSFFKEIEKPYLVVAPFSFWEERQWPFDFFKKVIEGLLKKKVVKKVIIVGGRSSWEEKMLKEFLKDFHLASILNLVGKTTLEELAFIIKNSEIYLGLDSGPSHLAYLLAKKVFVIFVSVDPKTRIPLSKEKEKNIFYFLPRTCPNFPCYNGIFRPDFKKCQKCAQSISYKEVLQKILFFFT